MKIGVKSRPARDRPAAMKKNGAAKSAQSAGTGSGLLWLNDTAAFDSFCARGYTRLSDCPEVLTAVNTLARLIGAMTIHLMENTERGDVRVRDSLSDLVDIAPNRYMTRSPFIQWIVRTLYLDGRGNAVVFPRTERGRLVELVPIPAAYVSMTPVGLWDYRIAINGTEFEPSQLLHFTLNPGHYFPWLGEGFTLSLADVTTNLKAASDTTRGFMESKWKPSLVVKVDAIDGMDTKEGRRKILDDFVDSSSAGEPWLIPAEQVDVKEVRPLTLSDLALADFVKLDKQTVATVLGIPPFVLGVGTFSRSEWNNFISASVMPIAQQLEQVLTRGLVSNPKQFFRFNSRSLYNYDLNDLARIASSLAVRGMMTGNEVRDWLGMTPLDGLDELSILENFIPRDKIGDQEKLTGGTDE